MDDKRSTGEHHSAEAKRLDGGPSPRTDVPLFPGAPIPARQGWHRTALDCLPEGILVLNKDLVVVFANQEFVRTMLPSLDPAHLVGRNLPASCALATAEHGEEYRYIMESGQGISRTQDIRVGIHCSTVDIEKYPVFEGDSLTHIVTVIRTHGEPSCRTQDIREITEGYRNAFEQSPVAQRLDDATALWRHLELLGRQGVEDLEQYFLDHPEQLTFCLSLIQVLQANRAAIRIFEAANDQELIDNIGRTFCHDAHAGFGRALAALGRGAQHLEVEGFVFTLSGKRLCSRITWSVLPREPHERFLLVVTIIDNRERKHAEKSLALQEKKYGSLFHCSHDGVVFHDLNGRIVEANRNVLGLFGYTGEELCALNIANLLAPQALPAYLAVFDGIRKTGPVTFESRFRKKTGEVFPAEVSSSVFDAGESPMAQMVIRDVTARKRLEQELLRNRSLESLGTFAGGIAHDYNNLLTSIFGYLELIKIYQNPTGKFHEWIVNMERAGIQAQHLTRRLLTFADVGEPAREVAPLQGLIRDSATFVLGESAIDCRYDFAENLWLAVYDRWQMGQTFHNILMNAREAMAGSGTIVITAENVAFLEGEHSSLAAGDYVKVAVVDQGKGILPGELHRVFEPYFTTKERGSDKGKGLGLAICYSTLKKHGGCIDVASEYARGTAFSLYVPAVRERPPEQVPGSTPPSLPRGAGRILIMEAGTSVGQVTGSMLRYLGYSVDLCSDGQRAVSLFAQAQAKGGPYDTVILDLSVPDGMGAIETIVELKRLDPLVRAIVSSGHTTSPVIADWGRYGFKAALMKPYQLQALATTIHSVITGGS